MAYKKFGKLKSKIRRRLKHLEKKIRGYRKKNSDVRQFNLNKGGLMAKNGKEQNLMDQAKEEMTVLVEQHNELVKTVNDAQARLAEVKQMLVEKQGYLKGLEDCNANCEK